MAENKTPQTNPEHDAVNGDVNWAEFELPEVKEIESKTRAVIDVPAPIVALAQRSLTKGVRLEMSFRGQKPEVISEFVRYMKAAGDHTTPQSSTTVVQDGIVVRFSAGQRRGRKPNTPAS